MGTSVLAHMHGSHKTESLKLCVSEAMPGAAPPESPHAVACLHCQLHGKDIAAALRYGPCEADSLKERMKRAVALLGPTEVQSIMRQEGKIEVEPAKCLWRKLVKCVGGCLVGQRLIFPNL